jgi:pimeloyl-ACP methyl ester carboxylesterase
MDYLAERDYDVWCVDFEGYGRSTKDRKIVCGIERGAENLFSAARAIGRLTGARSFYLYGISSGALRAALFAQRRPKLARRMVLDAFVWTGKGSPTLAERRKCFADVAPQSRCPVNLKFVESIFRRDHPGTAFPDVVRAYARTICALDDIIPNETYLDMCRRLPLAPNTSWSVFSGSRNPITRFEGEKQADHQDEFAAASFHRLPGIKTP